ncbi:TonB-dependent receptor [Glacieibacterium sp.]|uniref:TonB-dependent receptor n=1 Tax=Glacieibacterium sp. TaxID=2860237 RepID=UPI003AFF65E7
MKHLLLASVCALALPTFAAAQDTANQPAMPNQVTAPPAQTPAAATAASGATNAGAATAADTGNSIGEGGEIIITANRRAQALSTVPIAVSAVSQESLQNSGANDIRALNQLAPSLLVSSTGSEANGSARIRGIGTVGDNPGLESSVAVFIDGVYRSRTGSGLNELGEVERIEVLRGPQGTLFGRNASAGLINIITAKPSFELGGNAEATYGNYNAYRLAGGVTGGIIPDKLAARIDGVYVKRDGFYKDITTGDRVNNRNRYFVRGQLLFTPTDDISLRLIGDYTHRNESCCGAAYTSLRETTDTTPNTTTPGFNTDRNVTENPNNRIVDILRSLGGVFPGNPYGRGIATTPGRTYRNTTTDWGGSGQLDWDLGDVKLTSITAYRQYKAGGAGDLDYGNVDLYYRADDGNSYRRFKTFTQEARFQGSLFDGKLDWLVGGFYSREKLQLVDNSRFGSQYGAFAACRVIANVSPAAALRNPAAPGCLSATGIGTLNAVLGAGAAPIIAGLNRLSTVNNVGDVRSVYNQDSQNYAFFTHNIFNVTDRLSLTVGVRYTHESKKFDAEFNNNNTVCPAQQAALGPLLANPGLAALAGGIITLTCTGNSSSQLNALNLRSKLTDGQFTGTAILSWKPVDGVMTYASYAKGYKAGGFNLDRSPLGGPTGVFSPRTNANTNGDQLQFEAEKVDAYEVGVKLKKRAFSLNVAAFRQEFKSFQLNTFNGTVFVVQNINSCSNNLNGGDTDSSGATGVCTGKIKPGVISQGVEIESAVYPARNLALTVGYTYADTHYGKNLVGSTSGAALDPALFLLPGRQVSNAPKHVVTASLGFTPDVGTNGMSALFYVDSRLSSDYNTGSDLFPEKAQDGFVTVNARIGLRGKDQRWSVELWGQNIFNKNYQQVAFNAPFQGAGSAAQVAAFGGTGNQLFSSFLAEPRTYGATVRTRF